MIRPICVLAVIGALVGCGGEAPPSSGSGGTGGADAQGGESGTIGAGGTSSGEGGDDGGRGGASGSGGDAGNAGTSAGGGTNGSGGEDSGGDAGDAGDSGAGVGGGSGQSGVGGSGQAGGGQGGNAGSAGGGIGGSGGVSGAAGIGGGGGACDDGATERCCTEGTRTCSNGTWGACLGAFLSAESCNGIDDDCDGAVDEGLATFRCGLGACAREVAGCVDGALATCVPLVPETQTDGCNEIDDDCDGAVDEDCATCVHVSPTGDDAAAAANDGASPFASVQTAIDFAASFRSVAKRVCVAAGPVCGDTFTYPGPSGADLTMRNGIDVLGNYESTTWTRCPTAVTTILAPQTERGVYFPSSVVTRTVLDGFKIAAPISQGVNVRVEGARGVLISNVRAGYGIDVSDAVAQISRSWVYGVAVAAVNVVRSEVAVQENCPTPLVNGRCSACGYAGNVILGDYSRAAAIVLEDSPGSRVESNGVCASETSPEMIRVLGDARGTLIRANFIQMSNYANMLNVIRMNDCGGASPWLVDNDVYALGEGAAIMATGDCHPVIEANPNIVTSKSMFSGPRPRGIQCGAANGIASRCVVTTNPNIKTQEGTITPSFDSSTVAEVRAVVCDSGSCARVDHNGIVGLDSSIQRLTRHSRLAIGLELNGGRTFVDGNAISSGFAMVKSFTGYGVLMSGSHRFQNNRISSVSGGSSEFYSNAVNLLAVGSESILRNNIADSVSAVLPTILENNTVTSGSVSVRATATSSPMSYTLAELEGLPDVSASGNLSISCPLTSTGHLSAGSPCIDAGMPAGAPHFDFEGDRRGAQPDIGPDEYTP